jgi:hypothetical protein
MSEHRSWRGSTETLQERVDFVTMRVQILAEVFGKKYGDALVSVYVKHLAAFPIWILTKAFSRAETELERFPTPNVLLHMCGEAQPSGAWRYNFAPGFDLEGMPCLIDPDPPTPADRFMYKPQDCEEGRAFLASIKVIAGR